MAYPEGYGPDKQTSGNPVKVDGSRRLLISLDKGQKWKLCISLFRVTWGLLRARDAVDIVCIMKQLQVVVSELAGTMLPSPEAFRAEVNKRPFEPFGIPGLTDTTKMDKSFEDLAKDGAFQTQLELWDIPGLRDTSTSDEIHSHVERGYPLAGMGEAIRLEYNSPMICNHPDGCHNVAMTDIPGWVRCWLHRPTIQEVKIANLSTGYFRPKKGGN